MSEIRPNHGGIPALHRECISCGCRFSVTPAPPREKWSEWVECLADICPSYDISRDVDLFFDAAMEGGLIERD